MSVTLTDLVKEFRDAQGTLARVVDGVSLSVDAGELVTLLGPSGCGKTTTLRMIAGFETPTSGQIAIAGADVTEVPPFRRNVPMVFQSYALFPHLSVRDNAAFGLQMHGIRGAAANERVEQRAAAMHLAGFLDRPPHELSGGQQQRVALLRALVTDPRVLLFDEPLSNLDAQMRVGVRSEIRSMQKRHGITAIYVTHDQAEAMAISDRIVVMRAGRIVQLGPPAEVYSRPQSRFVASFLGEASFVAGQIVSAAGLRVIVDSPLGKLEVDGRGLTGSVTLVVRPEMLRLVQPGAGPRARVKHCTYFGADALCELELAGESLTARLFAPEPARLPKEGDLVGVEVDATRLHVLPSDSAA